ncbi:hypothetical protein JMN32_22120 [Fulvivirga sp. 29W222]|uniref:Outer membrane protein beta-barrel domain-containing protein n=1 Tax=Fulvivirga marina TaxID=2494733 RepID=A0A937FZQ7_9BACT|nr:hypothetical protein [Fulvivirga marina]MBL6449024.1 hypothetical protein [Fulvivirga marina]
MSNISDNDLDKLFKEAAEEYQASFDESAWEDMERRIDDGGDDGFSYFKILGGIIGVLLLGSIVIWKISSERQVIPLAEVSQVTIEHQMKERQETNAVRDNCFEAGDENIGVQQGGTSEPGNFNAEYFSNGGIDKETSGHGKNREELVNERDDTEGYVSSSSEILKEGESVFDSSQNAKRYRLTTVERKNDRQPESSLGNMEISSEENITGKLSEEDKNMVDVEESNIYSTEISRYTMREHNIESEKFNAGLQVSIIDARQDRDQQREEKRGFDEEPADDIYAIEVRTAERIHNDELVGVIEDKPEEETMSNRQIKSKEENRQVIANAGKERSDNYSKKDKQVWVYSPAFLEPKSYLEHQYSYSFDHRELNMVEIPDDSDDITGEASLNSRSFALKLAYSPDLTSVGYFEPDKPGSNFGLMGAYYINRWSISTGAIYSRKIYFSEESSGGGYYSGSSDFIRIDGDCRVIDIPVNISYYLSKNVNHGFYLLTGFSSYIMLLESYDFFSKANGTEKEWSSEYENKNNHFFSVLNLSLGYERQVKNGFFVQLEPFIKAPVAGIGEGKVDLVSTGAFLNLMYKFNQNK